MKLLSLQAKSSSKVARGERELSENDVAEIPKGLMPGEWIIIGDASLKKNYIGYCNPYAETFFKIKIVHEDKDFKYGPVSDEKSAGLELIVEKLQLAIEGRDWFKGYAAGSRLVYGTNDSLPGIIVDKYKKYLLIQINTAGMDRFRNEVRDFFQRTFPEMITVLFDNMDYRKSEVLPVHETEMIDHDLEVEENGITYSIPSAVIQKIGYYYDHRENRNKLRTLLSRSNKSFRKGLDLFSYVGSWGLHMLSAGVESVHFVDQADMERVISHNLSLNGFNDKGRFTRQDVFKFLDAALVANEKYDVIVSDPPAFTKSEKNKLSALQGYEKLHLKAMKLLAGEGLFVVASCTHYVSFDELDKTVQEAAFKNSQKVQLLDLGIQGFDHPASGFKDKSFYIKYMAYAVRRG